MKKVISLILCVMMLSTACICVSAANFTDLQSGHWAYNNVMTLVNDGTVNGYEDGTFKPSKTVTRAEFVKMIGKWNQKLEGSFTDISENHWGYDYIMWSGLEAEGTKIYPDAEMLRSDVINLIWKRNGMPKSNDAPGIISSQGTNKDATSWAYTIGLVQGDDGLNLRLDSSVTRAEAATLIVRSRALVAENKRVNFNDVVSEDLKKQIFSSTNIFDGTAYNKDANISYGELAQACMLLGAGGKNIVYDATIIETEDFIDHEYAIPLHVLANQVWGKEYYSLKKADTKATVQDVLSGLLYGLVRRSGQPIPLSTMDKYYSDCVGANSTNMENLCLTFAAKSGIKLNAGEKLNANKIATLGDVAALLLQIDDVIGLELGYSGGMKYNVETKKDLSTYPSNYKDYRLIIDGIPNELYSLKQDSTKPVNFYKTASECSFIYATYLTEVKNILKSEQGIKATLTYYPSLSYQENGKITFVAKCEFATDASLSIDTVFKKFIKEATGKTVSSGEKCYLVFETYHPLMEMHLPLTGAQLKEVIITH